MDKISPKYQMNLIQSIKERLYELYHSYDDVEYYLRKWHECDDYGDWENFCLITKTIKDNQTKIDALATLHSMPGELLLKIAIDLGIETPDFIPSIPLFKNEIKSSYETASQTFEKAFHNVENEPNLAIGLANSALESIIKEILKDKRILIKSKETATLSNLIKDICKAFKLENESACPIEIRNIASSLISCCCSIEELRSRKTMLHGKTNDDIIINDPICAYFIVNAVSTVGLFFLNFYKKKYPAKNVRPLPTIEDDLPF